MFKMGANIIDRAAERVELRVFAYDRPGVEAVIDAGRERLVLPMAEEAPHVYSTIIEGLGLDFNYMFRLGKEEEYPDPYSNYQPRGVHGFSRLTDHESYSWLDEGWKGLNLEDAVIMEIHLGTFTREGTFKAMETKLDYLEDLGINAVELMPVNETPGRWNWGYDGTGLFSVNHNYGTPDELKSLVDHCHLKGLAVILDVVYNHFGPEGNYLPAYGPYFTARHETPWGQAVNYDDAFNEYTRRMVLDNVTYWLNLYHIDGLRLDAVHAIKDESPSHILKEIGARVHQSARHFVIAETDANDTRIINPPAAGGYGIDAQWMDDFHHVIHTVLTGENQGYYQDYGRVEYLEKVLRNYLYTGQYSRYWGKNRGTDAAANPGRQFVVAIQNHDQVGNRARGERLGGLTDWAHLKAAAGLLFFAPYIPLIFMGEEYDEESPFLFFTDYQDPALQKAVVQGRKEEFKQFTWNKVPNPQDPQTFYRSKLTPPEQWSEHNRQMFNFYRDLIGLRRRHPVLQKPDKFTLKAAVQAPQKLVTAERRQGEIKLAGFFNLGHEVLPFEYQGRQLINSEWQRYGGQEEGPAARLLPGQMVLAETRL